MVAAEVSDDGAVESVSQGKAIAVRFCIMGVVVLVAVLAFDVLGSVESIVGAVCSMSSSMLLPAFFYLRRGPSRLSCYTEHTMHTSQCGAC